MKKEYQNEEIARMIVNLCSLRSVKTSSYSNAKPKERHPKNHKKRKTTTMSNPQSLTPAKNLVS